MAWHADPLADIFHQTRRGHVDHYRARFLPEPVDHGQGQREFLADVPAILIDQRQAVRIRVEHKSYIRTGRRDAWTYTEQVGRDRFRLVCKYANSIAAQAGCLAAEGLQQHLAELPTSAAVGIKHCHKLPACAFLDVNEFQDAIAMP